MDRSEFIKLLYRGLGFLVILVLIDMSFGWVAKRIFFSQQSGKYYRLTNSIYKDSSEVLIMGSSHANRHYVPDIIESELGLTCYNAGVQGQRLIFIATLQKMILARHTPKLIIVNIDEDWLYHSAEAYERLADLHPYYWDFKQEVDPVLSLHSKFNEVKLLSSVYQANSTLVHALKYALQPQKDFKGHRPLKRSLTESEYLDISELKEKQKSIQAEELDENFILMFKELIGLAQEKGVPIIGVVSPLPIEKKEKHKNESMELMEEITREYDIPVIDFSVHPSFQGKYNLYHDHTHLNGDGAIQLTELLADSIRTRFDLN